MILRPSGSVSILGSNGGWLPKIKRINRLHVVMAVEQNPGAGAVGRLADHDRMACGRPHLGGKTDALEIGRDMLGRRAAVLAVSGIGRDRLNAQQREQSFETLIEIAIDAIEHGVELAHDVLPLAATLRKTTCRPDDRKAPRKKIIVVNIECAPATSPNVAFENP